MALLDEKYYHRFCTLGDTKNDSCGQHTGCHEAYIHRICVNCNTEKYFEKIGEKTDQLRVTKEEFAVIKTERVTKQK